MSTKVPLYLHQEAICGSSEIKCNWASVLSGCLLEGEWQDGALGLEGARAVAVAGPHLEIWAGGRSEAAGWLGTRGLGESQGDSALFSSALGWQGL